MVNNMEGNMTVAVMEGIGKMGYTQRPIPKPTAREVLVKLEYVGICGSDMHYYETAQSVTMWWNLPSLPAGLARLQCHPVTNLQMLHILANFHNHAAGFVSQRILQNRTL